MERGMAVILFSLIIGSDCFSQAGGLSASKLNTLDANVIPRGSIEFEPSLFIGISSRMWDNDSKPVNRFEAVSAREYSSFMSFRFTYGISKRIETGISVDNSLSSASLGTKFVLLKKEKISTAAFGGVGLNGLNDIHYINDTLPTPPHTVIIGVANTVHLSKKISLDSDIQIQRPASQGYTGTDFFLNSDLGWYAMDFIQIVAGLNYSGCMERNCNMLIGVLGVTFEHADQFIIVLNMPFSILGRNSISQKGFGFALTLSFD